MNTALLIDRLRDEIAEKKVIAAVFYTFNFDPEFFENYLLPVFVPDVSFSDNQIQNAILWRKYYQDLPPITVYCDYHGKSEAKGPQLPYVVKTIDLATFYRKKGMNKVGCYHPKHSFILLNDGSLIVLTGSNNLSVAAWCYNIETVSLLVLKNGEVYPRDLKDAFYQFAYDSLQISDSDSSSAEELMFKFFNKRKYTGNMYQAGNDWIQPQNFPFYFNSFQINFFDFIRQFRDKRNFGEPFECVEIISPYFSDKNNAITLIEQIKEITGSEVVKIAVPFENSDTIAMEEDLFLEIGNMVRWCRNTKEEQDKNHRFNHSKVYRLKGKNKDFTIVGSVNFTMAAWSGVATGGCSVSNMETALVFENDNKPWVDYLTDFNNLSNFSFTTQPDGDGEGIVFKKDVPDLLFELNWQENTLNYTNDNEDVRGKFLYGKRLGVGPDEKSVKLNDEELEKLSDNPVIDVQLKNREDVLYYYPVQVGFESKPIPFKLKLKGLQILELWQDLQSGKNTISGKDKLEALIESICSDDGFLSYDKLHNSPSTLNTMAAHFSGLINLETKLFNPITKEEKKNQKEQLEYYLTYNNIDTLPGYLAGIKAEYEVKTIRPSFYWLLLNIVKQQFYDVPTLKSFGCYDASEKIKIDIIRDMKKVAREDLSDLKKQMKWVDKELRNVS